MKHLKILLFINVFFLSCLLSACGGGGSSATPSSSTTTGVAVDPYLVGAQFQEIAASDGSVVQVSTLSDGDGNFTFDAPLTVGNTIIQIVQGTHLGLPFTGTLKRKVDSPDSSPVVSPLTTLVAIGKTPAEVVSLLAAAGIEISEADVLADPMKSRETKPELVIASIAINIALNCGVPDLQEAVSQVAAILNQPALMEADADIDDIIETAVVLSNTLLVQATAAIQADADPLEALILTNAANKISETLNLVAANNAPIVLDDSGVHAVSITNLLAAGFNALETLDNDENITVETMLSAANNFQQAAALVDSATTAEEKDQALFFSAMTQLALLADPYSDLNDENGLNKLGDLLDAFGLAVNNSDRAYLDLITIEGCSLTGEDCDLPTLPADFPTSGDLQQMLATRVNAGLSNVIAKFDQVSSDFNKTFTDIEFDYADALFFKGVAQAMLVPLNIMEAYNFNIDLDQLQQDIGNDAPVIATPGAFLGANADLGTLTDAAKLVAAKTYAEDAVDTMVAAVNAIEAEYAGSDSDQSDDLISFYNWDYDSASYDEAAGQEMLDLLAEIEDGFTNPVQIDVNDTTIPVSFYNFFDDFDFREQLPAISEDNIGNFPDATLNGIINPDDGLNINLDENADGTPDILE